MITADNIAHAAEMVFGLIGGDTEVHEVLEALGFDPNDHQKFGVWVVLQIEGLKLACAESGVTANAERGYWLDGFLIGLAAAKLAGWEDAILREG